MAGQLSLKDMNWCFMAAAKREDSVERSGDKGFGGGNEEERCFTLPPGLHRGGDEDVGRGDSAAAGGARGRDSIRLQEN